MKTARVLLVLAVCLLALCSPRREAIQAHPHPRVIDDADRRYPGLEVSVEDVGDAYHQARVVLDAGPARWRILVERFAVVMRRFPGCLVVVDHWGSDTADCWVFVEATGRLWHLWPESGRFDHVYLHPTRVAAGTLFLNLEALGGGHDFDGPVARFDLATGRITSLRPEIATVVARDCPPGDPAHR